MLFLNPWLLAGLVGVLIPVIIHLVRQQAAKPVEWGAMRFLFDTMIVRRRKMEWEDLLLMAARCLLLALIALALARPFVPPDSSVPWLFVLPAALIGVALLGASFVLSSARWRWLLRILAIALLLAAAGLVWLEKFLNFKRFEASGRRDVALVIDASASMQISRGGKTMFELAVEEAREVVREAPRGTAFTVVLGGPAPEARTAEPLTHRADVFGVLDSLQPVGGSFRAHEALGMATLGLAEGTNASKEIIVFTDSQRHGWRFDNPGAWDGLGKAWEAMASKPKLIFRDFGGPQGFRNVALSELTLSRTVIGTDREVTVRVTVENTGEEPVTPGPIHLEVGGVGIGERPVGLLVAGQSETVEFRHHFKEAGPGTLVARIEANDDLPDDNRLARVVAIRKSLPVLLVDGNSSGAFFERASGYTALALAPGALTGASAENYLMDPEVIPASQVDPAAFDGRDVIVLADVPRLPAEVAQTIAARVAAGAGLIVIAGPRAEADFYNNWTGGAGPLLAMPLGEEAADPEGVKLAPSTYNHEALSLFKDGGDLDDALVMRWRRTGDAVEGGAQGAAFANGDAFLGSRTYGNGRTLLVTAALDARAGNLPAKRGFVPLVHELVTWVAGGGIVLNVESSWNPSVTLTGAGGGLSARYFQGKNRKQDPLVERVDPEIDFAWGQGKPDSRVPANNFSTEWSGFLVPRVSGNHEFFVEVKDRFGMKIPGLEKDVGSGEHSLGSVNLEAGKPVPFEAWFEKDWGNAQVRLSWKPPGAKREIIPASAFRSGSGGGGETLRASDPKGQPRTASVTPGRGGLELAIQGSAVPGIYEVQVGEAGGAWLPGWDGGTLPLAVIGDPAESRFEPMNEDDLDLLRSHIDVIRADSAADILGVLTGKGFGREIWKLLAVAAAILFLLESVLARWVSKSRRTAEDVRVEFGETAVWQGGAR